ncbi:MAG TPA: hypothetical protein DCE41_21905 [Cytophagales bacterium]|nr:hypothetical protein [Cytophagales bacterium]HAA17226.1 hypothetical protein [Cytophagales bacterium]HAP63089.1 hypothetical protein [Cytophagales bacterium]
MFTENEVALMVEDAEIQSVVERLKKEFMRQEAPYMEISNHDFLSLILLVPAIGVAYSNNNISLKEELNLNKKARKLSKGGYFIKKDPVVVVMQFLIKKFDTWEGKFLDVLKGVLFRLLDKQSLMDTSRFGEDTPFPKQVLNAPYIFIRFLSCFFLTNEEEVIYPHKALKVEHNKICDIGQRLDLGDVPIFQSFCQTYSIK